MVGPSPLIFQRRGDEPELSEGADTVREESVPPCRRFVERRASEKLAAGAIQPAVVRPGIPAKEELEKGILLKNC
jgi:hypothetical protein